MRIVPCASVDQPGWLELRQTLWPECPREDHLAEMAACLGAPDRCVQFIAQDPQGLPVGLAEAALRSDYVNGTSSSPVAFLEGIYVLPGFRRRGTAAALVDAVAAWARRAGCRELASDALLENGASHAMHRALGFQESERVVFYRMDLAAE